MILELSMRDRTTWVTLYERQRASPFPVMPATTVPIELFKSSAENNGSDFNPKTLLAIRLFQFVPDSVLRYIYRNSWDPRLKHLRQTNALSTKVARELVALKMEELREGVAKKDVLSLMSTLLLLARLFKMIMKLG
jgi:hypothetical protein